MSILYTQRYRQNTSSIPTGVHDNPALPFVVCCLATQICEVLISPCRDCHALPWSVSWQPKIESLKSYALRDCSDCEVARVGKLTKDILLTPVGAN